MARDVTPRGNSRTYSPGAVEFQVIREDTNERVYVRDREDTHASDGTPVTYLTGVDDGVRYRLTRLGQVIPDPLPNEGR